jgi:aerobic-type carbon monoxide dehydrogenase small subunit (CoxS/CutS family)
VPFTLNGTAVAVADGISLLHALREELDCRSAKDGCSPQGQCGCCTVWVDGAARVACVTPVRRVAGRAVTTMEGLPDDLRRRWVDAFVTTGASQCGFCTPGIVLRLAALEDARTPPTRDTIEAALRAHLCRCTGWQSIVEAACIALGLEDPSSTTAPSSRDPLLASWRAQLEGPAFQSSGLDVVEGDAGFADDTSPIHAMTQVGAQTEPASNARAAHAGTGRVQGRNSTVPLSHPVPVPEGEWALTLQTTWVEPAYLEPDASWCEPGGEAASTLANGGAFGGKKRSPVPGLARDLADATGTPARVVWRREDVVRLGPKRPPLAIALRPDGTGIVRLGRTAGSPDLGPLAQVITDQAAGVAVEVVEIAGPPASPDLRAAGWAEVLAAQHALALHTTTPTARGHGHADIALPHAGRATVDLDTVTTPRGTLHVELWAGAPLCPVTLRSYALGAVHQALGLVWSEGIAVDAGGVPVDLTIRSFGILPARAMPDVTVVVHEEDTWPVNGSDAVFVATLAAAYLAEGLPPRWPTRRTGGRAHEWPVAPPTTQEEPT